MRGWRIAAAAAVLVGTLALGTPAASAHTQVCTGAILIGPKPLVGMLALGQPATTFTIDFTSGGCLTTPPLSADVTITLHGWCEAAIGSGTVNGHPTNVVATEGELVLTGAATGSITLVRLGGVNTDPCLYHGFALGGHHAIVMV